jgi:hypothetical protein
MREEKRKQSYPSFGAPINYSALTLWADESWPSTEKRILSAVPNPRIWSFPHNRHFSHPTQSINALPQENHWPQCQ